MIRVKKQSCQLIGNKLQLLSECTMAIVMYAEILAKDTNKPVEEAIDIINQVAKEAYIRSTKDERI